MGTDLKFWRPALPCRPRARIARTPPPSSISDDAFTAKTISVGGANTAYTAATTATSAATSATTAGRSVTQDSSAADRVLLHGTPKNGRARHSSEDHIIGRVQAAMHTGGGGSGSGSRQHAGRHDNKAGMAASVDGSAEWTDAAASHTQSSASSLRTSGHSGSDNGVSQDKAIQQRRLDNEPSWTAASDAQYSISQDISRETSAAHVEQAASRRKVHSARAMLPPASAHGSYETTSQLGGSDWSASESDRTSDSSHRSRRRSSRRGPLHACVTSDMPGSVHAAWRWHAVFVPNECAFMAGHVGHAVSERTCMPSSALQLSHRCFSALHDGHTKQR
jgi:hypothetical protein